VLARAGGPVDVAVEAMGAQLTPDLGGAPVRVLGRMVPAGHHQDVRRAKRDGSMKALVVP
jgi:hypothetical protein